MLSKSDELLLIAKQLISLNFEQQKIHELTGIAPTKFALYKGTQYDNTRKNGFSWMKRPSTGYMGDRILRLYETMFGICPKKDNIDDPAKLLKLFKAYLAIYPNDDISTNRIYHFLKALQARSLTTFESCSSCKKKYFVYQEHQKSCCICRYSKKLQSSASKSNDKVING